MKDHGWSLPGWGDDFGSRPLYYDMDANPVSLQQWAELSNEKYQQPFASGKLPRWRIGGDEIGDVWVSTVWIGIDMAFVAGPPLIFETMVFLGGAGGEPLDSLSRRYPTREAALAGHEQAVAEIRDRHDVLLAALAEVEKESKDTE